MEHGVFGTPVDREIVFKVTKGPKFGFHPYCPANLVSSRVEEWFEMRPATPAQYFARLELMEDLSPGLTGFEGFTHMDGVFGIVTSQTWFAGRNATWKEITDWLAGMGFEPVRSDAWELPVRWYSPQLNIALFDVGESNIIWSDGKLVHIDIIPVRPVGLVRERVCEALGIG